MLLSLSQKSVNKKLFFKKEACSREGVTKAPTLWLEDQKRQVQVTKKYQGGYKQPGRSSGKQSH